MSLRTFRFLLEHPLSSKNKPKAFHRFLSWQIRSRLIGKPVAYEFVNKSRLLVYPGMTGATGNIYAGLHEFNDMAFVLHALRPEDLFVDVGANIGSYTVLAGAAVGATCVSVEPVPSTFRHLVENIDLNDLKNSVECLNIGLGKESSTLRFSADEDTMNHVVADLETCNNYTDVKVQSLDDVLGRRHPTVIKIDVEGWESNVIAGAQRVFSGKEPMAILIEFGLGDRYGFNEKALYQKILDFGFERATYRPFERSLTHFNTQQLSGGNMLFIRQLDYFKERVESSTTYKVLEIDI